MHVCETNKPISHSFLLPVSPNHSVTNFTEQKTADVAVKSVHQWEFDTQENRKKTILFFVFKESTLPPSYISQETLYSCSTV